MSIRFILFDLDGSLLPMDQDSFIGAYLNALSTYMVPHGFEPQQFIKTVWKGTGAMIQNNGSVSNEDAFWNTFASVYGEDVRRFIPVLDKFYCTEFQKIRNVCGYDSKAEGTIHQLQQMGYTVTLATNPIFPSIATESRIHWAGLQPDDFTLITTYENSSYCKPNCDYYRQVMAKLGAVPEECLMVGNDVCEDLIAETLGMKVFLLTGCVINKNQADVSKYPQGNLDALMEYIHSI